MITDSGFIFMFTFVVLGGLLSVGSIKLFIVFRQIVEGWFGE